MAPPQSINISVVIPVYNEEPNVMPLWDALRPILDGLGESSEVILVDDGSTDGSGEALDDLAASNPMLRVLHLDGNWGQSAALEAGFLASRGKWVVTLDADLQNDPGDIPKLLARRSEGDCICGVRVERHDNWIRRISSKIGNGVRNKITGESIVDTGCSLKVFRGDMIRRVRLHRGLHRFLPTLMRMEGAVVVEVPVKHHERHAGSSKYGIGNRMWTGLADCLAVRWLKSRRMNYQATEGRRGDPGGAARGGTRRSTPEKEMSGAVGEDKG